MLNVRLAGDPPVWEIAVSLAVAGDVFDGVFLCCPFSPTTFPYPKQRCEKWQNSV